MVAEAMVLERLVESGEDGGGWLGFLTKGHHDAAAVLAAAEADDSLWDRYRPPPQVSTWMVMQGWWRCVPVAGERGMVEYRDAAPNSRGAFSVTYFNVSQIDIVRWEAERRWSDADVWAAAADYSLDHSETVFSAFSRTARQKVGSLIGLNREDALARSRVQIHGYNEHLLLEPIHVV